ncbi:preprotein translocase subunit TatC [Novimethylophilus kurashikiensis]|uniref:Preprotein translocase subunit TatC n=1 Tax=Novimethylophilus kurashikiensis TaxID=1825523 RepID=A0A2R5FCA9_9PROT|nr:preprotein translocase subunit TatC [Novimethylophilus kurashikiensis]
MPTIAIDQLDAGSALLLKRALRQLQPGESVAVVGAAPELRVHLAEWCRARGHTWLAGEVGAQEIGRILPGQQEHRRWQNALPTGALESSAVAEHAEVRWGLAARGASVESSTPAFHFPLSDKALVWADEAPKLYAQAVAAQWNPDEAIDWNTPFELPEDIEAAVAQVMTYLIENENAALLVPARFLAQMHPHFREVMQLLAIQVADEARHIEVFTRRIGLKGRQPALSTAGGQASLKTLLDTPDFAIALFLLSVLGEGTFVNLLNFLSAHAPDPVTRQMCRLAAQDEARHVAFGMAHLQYQLARDPALRDRLANAIEQRFEALATTDGLNEEVLDALLLLAAGSWDEAAIRQGQQKVQELQQDMAAGRRLRLLKLGFPEAQAARLAALHTRNFM